jgi:L-alanine-DL-glutamate epimerase-like enolase superfamily enzyme
MSWEFKAPFRIAYRTRTHAETVLVEVEECGLIGRGEALGVSYRGETIPRILAQLHSIKHELEAGISRSRLQQLLPGGGARNALDCALWDLEAKRIGRRVWDSVGLPTIRPVLTAYTLSLDTPERSAEAAIEASQYPLIKLKLAGDDSDLARVVLLRRARPDARIIVDANQAWSIEQLRGLAPKLADLNVSLIEQPLPAGKDATLSNYSGPVPLCADESCQSSADLADLCGKYEYVNIKLDKTGGLTEALRVVESARSRGLGILIGCMGGTSLSMAPAFIVAQLSDMADLDGPLLLKEDVPHAIQYAGGQMFPPESILWG